MKLLLFSDVHCNKQHCINLVKKSREVDVVIGAGDIGHLRSGLEETISVLKKIKTTTIFVPGNNESYDELEKSCENYGNFHVLHGNGLNISGIDFYGIGGGIPVTPFGSWSWDFDEDQGRLLLKDCPSSAVLISHSPPKGFLDLSSTGKSLGSIAVKEALVSKNPLLLVCGHIHESSGKKEKFNTSTIINAGPLGIIYDI